MTSPGSLDGLKVLVVEDDLLLAEATADMLEIHGCEVVGPAPDLDTGLELARDAALDGALLDINLGGEYCFPIATALTERDIPYMFVTGYDHTKLIPREFQSARRLSKPADPAALVEAIVECFRQSNP